MFETPFSNCLQLSKRQRKPEGPTPIRVHHSLTNRIGLICINGAVKTLECFMRKPQLGFYSYELGSLDQTALFPSWQK